jgi:hypothetical protein
MDVCGFIPASHLIKATELNCHILTFPVIPNILMPFCLACAVQNDSDTLPYVVKTHIHIVVGNINNAVYFVWHFSMELEEYQCGKHISPKHCGC